MKRTNEILTELEQHYPGLARVPRNQVYRVPEGYFEQLADNIIKKLEVGVISEKSKERVQQVPQGYFETLSGDILARAKASELQEEFNEEASAYSVSALLKEAKTYRAPSGYFDQLSEQVYSSVSTSTPAKVVSLNVRKWWKYAAAAVVAAAITVASFQMFQPGDRSQSQVAVEENSHLPKAVQESVQYRSPEAFKEGIASLSDEEIAGYLEEHGSILDDEQLSNGIEVQGMPDEMDYLLNSNALEDYLKKINQPG